MYQTILMTPPHTPSHPNENIRRNDCARQRPLSSPPFAQKPNQQTSDCANAAVKNRPWLSLRRATAQPTRRRT